MPITTKPAEFYGHQFITRKVLTAFMDYFSKRIYIERYNTDGQPYRYIQVPIHYAQRERFFQVLKGITPKHIATGQDEGIKLDLNRVLPRMALNLATMNTNTENRLNKFGKLCKPTFDEIQGVRETVPTGVPMNLDLELSIITRNQDDTFQIFEQILPYFGTTFNLDLKILDDYEPESVSFSLNAIQPDQNDEFGVDDERVFIGIMNFTAKVNYYFIRRDLEYIKNIEANFHVGAPDDVDSSFKHFLKYTITADSLSPIEGLDVQPSTTVITTSSFPGVFSTDFSSDFS